MIFNGCDQGSLGRELRSEPVDHWPRPLSLLACLLRFTPASGPTETRQQTRPPSLRRWYESAPLGSDSHLILLFYYFIMLFYGLSGLICCFPSGPELRLIIYMISGWVFFFLTFRRQNGVFDGCN